MQRCKDGHKSKYTRRVDGSDGSDITIEECRCGAARRTVIYVTPNGKVDVRQGEWC